MNKQHSTLQKPFPTAWVMMMGVMIAIGPLAIDMYLPALTDMAKDFQVSESAISRSVPFYFMGLVVGQLIYGPLSDRVGRVLPLYIGMGVFVAASVVCATTNSEMVLFVARTVQALGASVTAVVTKAIIRDTLTPVQGAKAFSLMVLVMGIAPIVAPSLGALILKRFDWHMLFWFLAGYGVLNLTLTKFFIKETLSEENRNTQPVSAVLHGYLDLFKDKTFILPAVAGGLLQGAFFIYLTVSSELFQGHYGFNKEQFAMAFGLNALGFVAMTQVNQFLTSRFRLIQLLRFGALLQLISGACLLALGLWADQWFYLVYVALFLCIAGLGFTQPNATAIALAFQKKRAGTASAMQGAMQFSVGVFGGLLLSFFAFSPVVKLGIVITLLVGIGTVLVYQLDGKLDLSGVA